MKTLFTNIVASASVSIRRRGIFACWLALMVAATVGGWFYGRTDFVEKIQPREKTSVAHTRRSEGVFAVDSPQRQWVMRVKAATPEDFAGLLEEWKILYPDLMDGMESQQENSLRWLLAQWIVKDREGFVKAVTDDDFKSPHQAAFVVARLNPEMIDILHQFRTGTSGDGSQRELEAGLFSSVCDCYSLESCLSAAKLWAAELKGGGDDDTFKILAERSAAIDPDKIEAALDTLPEVARAIFAAEIIKQLPPEDAERRIALLNRLTPAQWDRYLGESLGEHGADYADAIFKLPASTTSKAQLYFMNEWMENDPDAAIEWFSQLPQDDAFGPAACGIFGGWASFDKYAALAWAESLPDGPWRDAVASSVASVMAETDPRKAWRLAASIENPEDRADAYDAINYVQKDNAPEEFRKELEAARKAVGKE